MADDSSSAHCKRVEIVRKLCSLPYAFNSSSDSTSVRFANRIWTIKRMYCYGVGSHMDLVSFNITIEPDILTGESAEMKILLPYQDLEFHLNLEGPPNPRRKFGPFIMRPNSLCNADTFTIKLEKSMMQSTSREPLFAYNIIPSEVELLKNVTQLYRNQEMCDVTLKVREKEFPAHKTILSAASPVFKAMFVSDFCEAHTNVVKIKDFEPDAIREMLQFVYTQKAPQFSSPSINASCLYEAAHKYGIKNLLQLCRNKLSSSFDMETALDRLMLADKYDDQHLKQKSLNFICKNPPGLARVLKDKEYFAQRPELLEDILACKFKQK